MFPPQEEIFQQIAAWAVQIAALMVGLGLAFLFLDKTRLMFVCFGCSAAICFFKNETILRQEPTTILPTGSKSYNVGDQRFGSNISETSIYEFTQKIA
jgi:hypothetical protein